MYNAKFYKDGNRKVGKNIWTFNKLAGSGIINGCRGTCGKYCKGCYDKNNPKNSSCYVFKTYRIYGWDKSSVVKGHINNTTSLRNNIDSAFNDLSLQLRRCKKKPIAIRIHASGEIESANELRHWIILAKNNQNYPFYIYTKNFTAVNAVLKTEILPNNFYLNISIWHESGLNCYKKWKNKKNVRAFVYDDGYKYPEWLKPDCHCPAYNIKGKLNHDLTCDKCKICYQDKNKVCYCYEH